MMATRLDPLIHDHDTQEEADAYDAWFRKEVKASIDEADQGELVPHEQVMQQMDEIIRHSVEKRRK